MLASGPTMAATKTALRIGLAQTDSRLGEVEKWTEELRREADVVVYPAQPAGGPLPPVVKKVEKPAAKKPPALP